MGRLRHTSRIGAAITALAVAAAPTVARAEAAPPPEGDAGRTALVAAATVAWVLLLALVAIQFLRQRRLARRLDEIESTLGERQRDADADGEG